MSHKIIKPEGIELIEYLNNGYAFWNGYERTLSDRNDSSDYVGFKNETD